MRTKPKPHDYAGALAIVRELAFRNALEPGDVDMADEADRQQAALDTVRAFMDGHADLLGRLTVPVAPAAWPEGAFDVAADADMGEVVPALCVCRDLAYGNLLGGEGAEARRQARAVDLVGALVVLHRHELAEAVETRRAPAP